MVFLATGALAKEKPAPPAKSALVPYSLLNPPKNVTPGLTRSRFPASPTGNRYPFAHRTPEERKAYEARVDWFHQSKYGMMFHFLPRLARGPIGRIGESWQGWTDEKWDAWVDAVDVEKVADQAKELGVGFVSIAIGQHHKYICSANPLIEKFYNLKPGQYSSQRDLPMDLAKALEKRGIKMMLYISTDISFSHTSRIQHIKGEENKIKACQNWVKVCEWYSQHYGDLCQGWWVDGLTDFVPHYAQDITNALRSGNKNTVISSGSYELSDFVHGHCTGNWKRQQLSKPYYGRWDPVYRIQSHVFLTVGSSWGSSDTPKSTPELVNYASDVVKGGGVITFDVGIFKEIDGKLRAPALGVDPAQFEQLKAVRDALQKIPASDGSGGENKPSE